MTLNATEMDGSTDELTENTYTTQSALTSLVPIDGDFYRIHYTALVSLGLSIVCSIGTLLYQHRVTVERRLWRRKLGERLVVYLSVTDLLYSICHTCDHLISLVYTGLPPPVPCVIFAFSLVMMILAQNMVVLITAISLFLLVAHNRRVLFGPYDVGLLTVSYGTPAIICSFCVAYGFFGATGYWCLTDATKKESQIVHQILGFIQVVIAALIILLYSIVWIHLSASSRRLRKFSLDKTHKSTSPKSSISSGTETTCVTSSGRTVSSASIDIANKPIPETSEGMTELKASKTETTATGTSEKTVTTPPENESSNVASEDMTMPWSTSVVPGSAGIPMCESTKNAISMLGLTAPTVTSAEGTTGRSKYHRRMTLSEFTDVTVAETPKLQIRRHMSYKNTAKILTLFVLAYVAQWWPTVAVPIWHLFGQIPLSYYPVMVFCLNCGGLFNLCAYTVARRKYAQTSKAGIATA